MSRLFLMTTSFLETQIHEFRILITHSFYVIAGFSFVVNKSLPAEVELVHLTFTVGTVEPHYQHSFKTTLYANSDVLFLLLLLLFRQPP